MTMKGQKKHPLGAMGISVAITLLVVLSACSTDPQKGKVKYLESGQRYRQKGKYQEAAIQFRNALKLDPRFAEAFYQLAQVDLDLHQWNEAYAALQQAVELEPGRLDVHLDLGRLYLAAGEFRKAEDEASFILEREPRNVGAYQLLGGSLAARQQNDRAIQAFAKAAELSPKDPSSYINLALAEIGLSRFADAEKNLERAVRSEEHTSELQSRLHLVCR